METQSQSQTETQTQTGSSHQAFHPAFYLVVDLEATCDLNQRKISKYEMEIIEIGGVLVDGESLAMVDEVCTFVRPVRHPKLTDFCEKLTTIRQADVNKAPLFPEALGKVRDLLARNGATHDNTVFCSWGAYDRNQFVQDARFHANTPLPFRTDNHINLKKRFSEALNLPKELGMAGALKRAGLKLEGTHHRGIDDARNIARLMPWMFTRTLHHE